MPSGIDRHHVLYNKREWESRPQYKELRQNPGLIVPMDREIHNDLHRSVPFVPVMGYHGIMAVIREFHRGRTHLDTIDNLMFATEESIKNPKMSDLEKALSGLALESLEMQRPFIVEGGVEQ